MKSYSNELNNYTIVKVHKLIMILWVTMAGISCSESAPEPYVQAELKPYFDAFIEEGAIRGVQIDYTSLQVEGIISETTENNAVGQCSHSKVSPNKVTIDAFFWRQASHTRKEFVIFHELGHCYLGRAHLDDKDEYGICLSIMQSTADVCESNYENDRSSYLDELFSK